MNRYYLAVMLTFVLLCGAACQSQTSATKNNTASSSAVANTQSESADYADKSSNITNPAGEQILDFASQDGVKIVSTFYQSTKENSPAVLMLHQWGSDRSSYQDLARKFQASGIAVLAIDGRGFGESIKKVDGSKVSVSQSNEAVTNMKLDVAAAVKFLNEQKNVDKTRIGIIGASYGSSLAIIHASENPEIKAVALLSPGTNYFGNLPTEPAMGKYGARSVLIIAAEDDAESAEASHRLDKLATGDKHLLQIYKQGGHGTGILNAGVGLDKLLLEFFQKNL